MDIEVLAAYRVWSERQGKDPGPLATFDAGWQAALTWIDTIAAQVFPDGAVASQAPTMVR